MIVLATLHVTGTSTLAQTPEPLDFPEPVIRPDPRCEPTCSSRQTMPVGGPLPSNFRILIDGNNYDVAELIIRYVDPDPSVGIAGSVKENQYTNETGVYEVVFDEPGHPVPGGEYFVGAMRREGSGGIFSRFTIGTEDDSEPPFADGMRLDLDEIFTNDCGAKAILIRTNLAADSQTGGAMPLLVELETSKGKHHIWSSISRVGSFFLNGWLHDGTYFQDCIGPTGIESLELEGEVTVTFTLFDYAGNAAEPIVQVVEWPAELGPAQGGSGGAAGASGAGGGTPSSSGGCAVRPNASPFPAAWLGMLVVLALGCRKLSSRGSRM